MKHQRRRAGFTIIELMVTIGILAIIGIGAAQTFSAAVDFQTKTLPRMQEAERPRRIEMKIEGLLRGAYLGMGTGAKPTFFTGQASGQSSWDSGLGDLSDTLTFTSLGKGPSSVYLSDDDEFQNLNERFGPQGGLMEIAIEPIAVGDSGESAGPFLRTQRPSDGDPSQGGWETNVDPDIVGINFEFWDGTTWQAEWDSNTMQPPRLPAAIRVNYQLTDDDQVRSFVVRLAHSDVTPENPASVGEGAGG